MMNKLNITKKEADLSWEQPKTYESNNYTSITVQILLSPNSGQQ